MSTWRWENVPLPEAHLAALAVAGLAHLAIPIRIPIPVRVARVVGWALAAGGLALGAWAVVSSSEADVAIDAPDHLVTTGAYARSRNPMYVAWSAVLAGVALAARSAWLLVAAGLAAVAVHREVVGEESALAQRFGAEYDAYRSVTPRYLGRPRP
jgi:protein-S-isoprenylcysteine O-methyltransferase Ste14